MTETKAYLILENGFCFEGIAFGEKAEAAGEVVFTTAMTGYMETLTDKSCYGQIVVQTFPLIGNYGVIFGDCESGKINAAGYVVGDVCASPSNFRSGGTIDSLLRKHCVPGIYGVDTRRLTKMLRTCGTMNGCISYTPEPRPQLKGYLLKNVVKSVSVNSPIAGRGGKYNVAMLDYGYKEGLLREAEKRGCSVTIFPFDTSAEEITDFSPDGILLSSGPGDPVENHLSIENLKVLLQGDIPIFGVCLGHLLLASAAGFSTERLKFGHRGANQPAKDLITGRTYITSQNHGYVVKEQSINPNIAKARFINLNDGTNEGLIYKRPGTFSVQFCPEGCGGPRDTAFLFDEFVKLMGDYKSAER